MAAESREWSARVLDAIGTATAGPATAALHTGPPDVITGLPKVIAPAPLEFLNSPGPIAEFASRLARDLDWMTAMVLQRKAEMGCGCELESTSWDESWREVTVRFRNDGACPVHTTEL